MPVYPYKTKGGTRWRYVINLPRVPGSNERPRLWERGFDSEESATAAEFKAKASIRDLPFQATGNLQRDLTALMAKRAAGPIRIGGKLEPPVKLTTHDAHMSKFKIYIFPHIGHLPTGKAATNEVMRPLYAMLKKRGGVKGQPISDTTLATLHGSLMKCFKMLGVDVNGIDPPAKEEVNPFDTHDDFVERTWTFDQCRAFLDHLEGNPRRLIYQVIMVSGMRRGEAVGLKWRSVLFDKGCIKVENQITKLAGSGTYEGAPKNRSFRMVPLGDQTMQQLFDLHEEVQPAPDDYVFLVPGTYRPWEPNSVTDNFRKICERTGLPYITLHGLRHSLSTNAANSGVSAVIRKELLGHKSEETTKLYYDHAQMVGMRQATGDVEAAILTAGNVEVIPPRTATSREPTAVERLKRRPGTSNVVPIFRAANYKRRL